MSKYPQRRKRMFTLDELGAIYELLRIRDESGGSDAITNELHSYGFFLKDHSADKPASFTCENFLGLIDSGEIGVADDVHCPVCVHMLNDHELFGARAWITRQEGYFDVEKAFCADCADCTDDVETLLEYADEHGVKVAKRGPHDAGGMGLEDWSHGFVPAWDQPQG